LAEEARREGAEETSPLRPKREERAKKRVYRGLVILSIVAVGIIVSVVVKARKLDTLLEIPSLVSKIVRFVGNTADDIFNIAFGTVLIIVVIRVIFLMVTRRMTLEELPKLLRK